MPIPSAAPGFAEANDYVFGDLLGLTAEQLASLESQEIVTREPKGANPH